MRRTIIPLLLSRHRLSCCCLIAVLVTTAITPLRSQSAQPPVPGQNINMLGGLTADPFLQKQNEPSIAFSTRNNCHLLAGANDYRTVNLPGLPDDQEIGDAWVGLYKSIDCGQTWKSDLVPGYPQDRSPEGLASPASGLTTAADPVVRSGAGGLFFYGFIAFNRGSNVGRVMVARYIDNNNKEAGNPFEYLGTTLVASGSSGRFLDKQNIAVRMVPGTTCNINGQIVPGHDVFVAWTQFVGNGSADDNGRVYIARLGNCGQTLMGSPKKLVEGNRLSQGATIAVDPRNSNVYVAWREFQTDKNPHAIYFSRSTDGGQTFSSGTVVPLLSSTVTPFDQGTTSRSFRTNAFPSMAVDHVGRVWLALAVRGFGPADPVTGARDARVVLTYSANAGQSWLSTPVAVDSPGFDAGGVHPAPPRGHQIMPALAYGGGRLHIVWYDVRDTAAYVGNNPSVFGPFIQEVLSGRRHTIDVRGAEVQISESGSGIQLLPYGGIVQPLAPAPTNPVAKISQYLIGGPANTQLVQPLQFNQGLLQLYAGGTKPFMGDYLDVQTVPFLPTAAGGWTPNLYSATPQPFQAAWTDNRDALMPPLIPAPNPDTFTLPYQAPLPPGSVSPGNCAAVPATTRNSNVYTSRITPGVFVYAPGNSKNSIGPGELEPRAFPVGIINNTDIPRRFRLDIVPPTQGSASFTPFAATPSILVDIPRGSSAARTVYVRGTTGSLPAVRVNVFDVTGVSDTAGTAVGSATLNPDPRNPEIENPEIENPEIENPEIENIEVHNPEIENPEIENPEIENPEIENPEIENPEIENRNVQNPEIENPEIENPEIENPEIENPEIENPEIENGSITDVTVDLTNNGNTTSAYQVNFAVGGNTNPWLFQLVAWRSYVSPTAKDCVLAGSAQAQVLVNIANPDLSGVFPDANDDDPRNATVLLAPGETIKLTLRVIDKDVIDDGTQVPGQDDQVTPFVPFCEPGTTCEVTNPIVVQTKAQPPNTGETEPQVDVEAPSAGAANWPVRFVVQPSDTVAGAAIAPPVAVEVRDLTGAVLPGVSVTMSLTPNHPTATLSGTLTQDTDETGTAFFADLVVDQVGDGYSLIATVVSGDVETQQQFAAESESFDVLTTPIATRIVTTTNDAGAGSLREAIQLTNATPGFEQISFNIPGGGLQTISIATPLPIITDPVFIDGWTQPGWEGSPQVGLSWQGVAGDQNGFELETSAAGSILRGFRISNFGDNTVGTSGSAVVVRAANTTVHGNEIGIGDSDGVDVPAPNHFGIVVEANNVTIGGTSQVQRNVISSGYVGIQLLAGSGTTVAGNYIGTNPAGNSAFGNAAHGIEVAGDLASLTIGGTALGSGNVISGNGGDAIRLADAGGSQANGTIIARNIIGLAAPGSGEGPDDLPNLGTGIFVQAFNTTIGLPGAGNYIAESGGNGITITSPGSNATIQSNVIGWSPFAGNPAGSPRGNNGDGISVTDFSGVVIGGAAANTRNVIANNETQILVGGPGADGTVIQGNYIGLTIDGAGGAPNGAGSGIVVGAPNIQIVNNVVGGAGASSAPGTGIPGIVLNGNAGGSSVRGNRIGTNAAGTSGLGAFGNQGPGILVDAAPVTIGGPDPADGNLISANRPFGIEVTINGVATVIESNMIGTDITGTLDLGNGGVAGSGGILINSFDVRVGGANHTAVNTIRHNEGPGIVVASGTGNQFPGILSYDNLGGVGIDLGNDGVINNDSLDADAGANNLQNTLAGIGAGFSAGTLRLAGTFRGLPNQTVSVRWYRNTACVVGSENEGEEYLGETTGVALDPDGQGFVTAAFAAAAGGGTVSALLVDDDGNTSEFIDCGAVATSTGFINFEQPVDGSSQSLTVTVTDALGAPVPGATVTVIFSDESPGNTFNDSADTFVSTVTNAAGQGVLNFSIDDGDPTVSLVFTATAGGFSFPRGVSVTFSSVNP